jgi:copper transport protein
MKILLSRLVRTGALVALLGVLLLPAGIAWAHAELLRSNPAAGVVLRSPPRLVHLWFSEDLNGAASRVVVWDRYRHEETVAPAIVVPGHPRQMEVRLKPLPPGSYLVIWTSVSADDGHLLRGSYLFSVKHRGPGPSLSGVTLGNGQGFPDLPGMLAILAHWIELLTAVAWCGVVAFSALIFGPLSNRVNEETLLREYAHLRRLVWITIPLMILSSLVLIVLDAYGIAGDTWSGIASRSTLIGVFADQYGQLWVARQVVAVIALLLAFRIGRSPNRQSRSEFAGALTVIGAIYLYAFAASGHAAAAAIGVLPGSHEGIFSISVFIDWLHFLADAGWLGGQIALVLVLIPALFRSGESGNTGTFLDSLNRFSPLAYASIATFTLSGAFNGKIHIPSWYAFFASVYGRTLIVKMVFIGAMMLVSVYTVYGLRPRIKRRMAEDETQVEPLMSRLHAFLRLNPLLGAGVLLATSVMFYYPVPPGISPSGNGAYTVRGAGLTATLTIRPDRSGPNRMTVVLHRASGARVREARVAILTTMLDMPMGTGIVSLSTIAPGTFSGTADLGMGGHWRFQILVYQPSGLTRLSIRTQVGT